MHPMTIEGLALFHDFRTLLHSDFEAGMCEVCDESISQHALDLLERLPLRHMRVFYCVAWRNSVSALNLPRTLRDQEPTAVDG